jgi:NADH:ubiquinone oxidoreductase subunit 3 (subunit A)
MTTTGTKKEIVIFIAVITVVGIAALVAFRIVGPMGIEERFQNALGIPHDAGDVPGDSGVSGFSLEGQPLLYAVVLCVLGIICIAAYRHF